MPNLSTTEELVQYLARDIHDRLSGPQNTLAQVDDPLMLDEVIYGFVDDDRSDDFYNDVIPEHIRPLLQLGTEKETGIALELLDLGTGRVFVLLHAEEIFLNMQTDRDPKMIPCEPAHGSDVSRHLEPDVFEEGGVR